MTFHTPFSIKEKIQLSSPVSNDFYCFLENMKDDMQKTMITNEAHYFDLNTKAVLGDREAVAFFISEIERYLRRNPFTGKVPEAYGDISTALFHEWKGFGPAYAWFLDRNYCMSTDLQIIGKQIFYNDEGVFKAFPHQMSSIARVEQLMRTLLRSDPTISVNRTQPAGELQMNDPLWPGRLIRIAIWVTPRVWEGFTTITLRRQIFDFLNLDDQIGTGAIPSEAKEMLHAFFLTKRRNIVAGAVNSGKSTYANTIVGEQLLVSQNDCKGVVMIEKHPESILPHVIQGHRIIPIQAANEQLMDVGIESLRHNPDIIYMTEMRYHEWEFFFFASQKGHEALTGTYHTDDPEDIPYQAAIAVYTRIGGYLQGHMISACQAIEFVHVMQKVDGGGKRLVRLSHIHFDSESKRLYANDILRWDRDTDQWYYNDQLHPDIIAKMEASSLEGKQATQAFMSELRRLSSIRRIQQPMKESLVARQIFMSMEEGE